MHSFVYNTSDIRAAKQAAAKNPAPGVPDKLLDALLDCTLCPRNCHADRLSGQTGYCGQTGTVTAARAALHFWEEPCISGTGGSGTVFFSGCNLQCVFCQNHSIAHGQSGQDISAERLAEIFLQLQEKGAHNINLVTPTHFVPQIVQALSLAKRQGLQLPIVYNTGSYEKTETLRMLDGFIDIYLPDLKYFSPELSLRFSHAADYFEKATAAIAEMFRQVGTPVFSPSQEADDHAVPDAAPGAGPDCPAGDGSTEVSHHTHAAAAPALMQRGVIVRHLLLPGQTKDSKKILRYLHETYGDDIYVSIMNQYTPLPHVEGIPELNRTVTSEEYARVLKFAEQIGITRGFRQEGGTARESFIPPFDGTGL